MEVFALILVMWEYIWCSEVLTEEAVIMGVSAPEIMLGIMWRENWIIVNTSLTQFSVIPMQYHLPGKN